jgi:hypothetical protein
MPQKPGSASAASEAFLKGRRRRPSDVDNAKHALVNCPPCLTTSACLSRRVFWEIFIKDLATAQEENVFLFVPNIIGKLS